MKYNVLISSLDPTNSEDVLYATATMDVIVMIVEAIYGSWLRGDDFGQKVNYGGDEEKSGRADDAPGVSGLELYDPEDSISDLELYSEGGESDPGRCPEGSGPEPELSSDEEPEHDSVGGKPDTEGSDDSDSEPEHALQVMECETKPIPKESGPEGFGSDASEEIGLESCDLENSDSEAEHASEGIRLVPEESSPEPDSNDSGEHEEICSEFENVSSYDNGSEAESEPSESEPEQVSEGSGSETDREDGSLSSDSGTRGSELDASEVKWTRDWTRSWYSPWNAVAVQV